MTDPQMKERHPLHWSLESQTGNDVHRNDVFSVLSHTYSRTKFFGRQLNGCLKYVMFPNYLAGYERTLSSGIKLYRYGGCAAISRSRDQQGGIRYTVLCRNELSGEDARYVFLCSDEEPHTLQDGWEITVTNDSPGQYDSISCFGHVITDKGNREIELSFEKGMSVRLLPLPKDEPLVCMWSLIDSFSSMAKISETRQFRFAILDDMEKVVSGNRITYFDTWTLPEYAGGIELKGYCIVGPHRDPQYFWVDSWDRIAAFSNTTFLYIFESDEEGDTL